jgi:hypothetical protein
MQQKVRLFYLSEWEKAGAEAEAKEVFFRF